ncbi:protein HOMOLOG OF MAMMALIAN LYST-INTERACTING PROTEIN 5 [Curcuma longa]|uniref:protein HOMOLOG OF MAMMALIAN LYST-INTERACTING PROTEIN 5 n=1 Tax=Curcuma longa TaxID=136217 RepID=UPI003D9E1D4F
MSGMGSEGEPAKLLLPYLQRADELQKHEPLVAYYCRLYAMERGLKIPQKDRTKTTNSILLSLMKQLEKDKKSLQLGPEDNLYVEGFASNLFTKADKQDRAGRADLNTAKTFYAASIFFEILYQFGELQPEIEQKQKYAVWKAADIRKALKEGRKPEPGPPGGDPDQSFSSGPSSYTYGIQPSDGLPSSQQFENASTQDKHKNSGGSEHFVDNYRNADLPPQNTDEPQGFSQAPSSYPGPDYPNDIHHVQPTSQPEYPDYSQKHEHHSYGNEYQHIPQNSQENLNPTFSYPNFQSYPSFHDSTFPAAPTHQSSYNHDHDSTFPSAPTHQPSYNHDHDTTFPSTHQPSYNHDHDTTFPSPPTHQPTTYNRPHDPAVYAHQSAPVQHYAPPVQYTSSSAHLNHGVQTVPSSERYKYDSNYQPSAAKIAEAHKAARFAVGALAFDDVTVAVDHLRRSLELLTNPSAETH